MDNSAQQIIDRLKQAMSILVTVSANPSVDQLAACIGLTLALNKAGKHATAVFSGAVPPAMEFLQPEKTLEKDTNSLQDFIIALDKSKADKLRYKVEDKVVKIFITPYKTSISERDLEFSQGDFNVDVVLALGVHAQADLDQAIISHGRILHDATVMTMNVRPGGELGSVNWVRPAASSLSELAVDLVDGLGKQLIDGQIATAFLTGIVAETDRFSNARTSPETMSISAELMSLGANQQLVATKLEEPAPLPPAAPRPMPTTTPATVPKSDDGTLEINHDGQTAAAPSEPPATPEPEPSAPQVAIDEQGTLHINNEGDESESKIPPAPTPEPKPAAEPPETSPVSQPLPEPPKPAASSAPLPPNLPPVKTTEGPKLITEPPTFESHLTANSVPEDESGDVVAEEGIGLPRKEAPLPDRALTPDRAPEGKSIQPPEHDKEEKGTAAAQPPAPAKAEAPSEHPLPEPTHEPAKPPSEPGALDVPAHETPVPSGPNLAAQPAASTLPPLSLPPLPGQPGTPVEPAAPAATGSSLSPINLPDAVAAAPDTTASSQGLNLPPVEPQPATTAPAVSQPPETLDEIERDVRSPHLGQPESSLPGQNGGTAQSPAPAAEKPAPPALAFPPAASEELEKARAAVNQAINSAGQTGPIPQPEQRSGAQELGAPLHPLHDDIDDQDVDVPGTTINPAAASAKPWTPPADDGTFINPNAPPPPAPPPLTPPTSV